MTSPVRARSKASGLTRIRVRLTAWAPLFLFAGRRVVGRRAAGGAFAGARSFRFAFAFARLAFGGRRLSGGAFFSARRTALRRRFFQLAVAFAFALVPGGAAALPLGLLATLAGERGLAVGAEAPA